MTDTLRERIIAVISNELREDGPIVREACEKGYLNFGALPESTSIVDRIIAAIPGEDLYSAAENGMREAWSNRVAFEDLTFDQYAEAAIKSAFRNMES